jgi:hypothetical protein
MSNNLKPFYSRALCALAVLGRHEPYAEQLVACAVSTAVVHYMMQWPHPLLPLRISMDGKAMYHLAKSCCLLLGEEPAIALSVPEKFWVNVCRGRRIQHYCHYH